MSFVSATQLGNTFGNGSWMVTYPGMWSAIHVPAVNVQATATQAAGGTGVRHICWGISATLVANTTAPAAAQVTLNLIDGASGGTAFLWREQASLQAVAGDRWQVNLTGLNIPGSAATAMTLEFSAAGGANTFESVTLFGYDVS